MKVPIEMSGEIVVDKWGVTLVMTRSGHWLLVSRYTWVIADKAWATFEGHFHAQ
jgi:hypothetical protein